MTGRRLAKSRHARRSPVHVLPGLSCLLQYFRFDGLQSSLRCSIRGSAGVICDGTEVESQISRRTRATAEFQAL